jgi:dienelactone hydrolase
LGLFADHVYGQLPTDFDRQIFEEELVSTHVHADYARLKQVKITVSRNAQKQTIRLKIYYPKAKKRPFPVFLLISHRNVEQITGNPENQFFPVKHIVSRGYAAAVFDVEDVSPDSPERFKDGILNRLYPEQLQMTNGMRGLSAWAWGAMRVMDYIEKDPELDEKRSVVVGHSRGGKAALWCGANDTRWAVTVSNESGCGGAAISRRKFGETVERINKGFPYWFTDNFKNFNGREEQLPVDQHQLIGLIAPRAVYVSSAMEDKWADPKGEYLSLKIGSRVDSEIYQIPVSLPENYNYSPHVLHQKSVGYHLREGKHDLIVADWEKIMDFALLQFE